MKFLQPIARGVPYRAFLRSTQPAFSRRAFMAHSHKVFQLGETTQLHLQTGDITKWSGDAIVNAANERMLGGGGVDGAIHRAAGSELLKACNASPEVRPGVRCPTGEARLTRGFNLPAKHVIHTVGPVFSSHQKSSPALFNAYKNSLELAKENSLESIAFPAISCGVYGYPLKDAAGVAFKACNEHGSGLKDIHFVLFGDDTFNAFTGVAENLEWLKASKSA